MRDGVALLAILARVRRRLRALAALEATVVAAAAMIAASAIVIVVLRWHAAASLRAWRLEIAAAIAVVGLGALAGALRRIPLDRCARFIDRALDGGGARHDRVLSALAFTRTADAGTTKLFMRAAIADAVARAQGVAPRSAAPLRRPRATPAFAAAAVLLGIGALSPLPARGSRAPVSPLANAADSAAKNAATRVRLPGRALDPERDEVAAAMRAASELRDPELAGIARALAATVTDLSNRGLDPGEALDRMGELLRRADQAADELAGLPHALEQAGAALQATAATRDSGLALAAEDGAATERAIKDLAARAATAADDERNRIAASLDRAGDRAAAGAIDGRSLDGQPTSPPTPGSAPSGSATTGGTATSSEPESAADDADGPNHRHLARDQPRASSSPASGASAGGPSERRLQRLQRELKQTASACRADPEACRQRLQRQSRELPRMEDEARSLAPRQRLAEAVRQLRERLRREGGGARDRAREERRFMRSARGEKAHARSQSSDGSEARDGSRGLAEDPDGVSDEGDDMESESADSDGAGTESPLAGGDGDRSEGAAGEAQESAGQGASGQETANGDGIGSQRGNDPLGERGSMITRGHAREAAVKDGTGPTRSQVIQSAARRGFSHTSYQNVFTDYQAVVEESLDGSAVPPGRRYTVRRYFQLIRPQSARGTQSPAATR